MQPDPKIIEQEVRQRIFGGGRISLDTMNEDELAAMAALINEGVAEIVKEACRPILVRKLDP